MLFAITRLAVSQVLAIVYSVLVVGVILKVRYDDPAPELFATHLRDKGFLLFVVPVVWLVWACVFSNRPRVGAGSSGSILASGLFLLGLLILLAFVGTISACSHETMKDPFTWHGPLQGG